MNTKRDKELIRDTLAVLEKIASEMGENELLNAVAREARIIIAQGEILIAKANPHVKNREELVAWAQDCAALVDYISAATLRH